MDTLTAEHLLNRANDERVRDQFALSAQRKGHRYWIGMFVKLLQHFGFVSGTRLFSQIITNKINALRLPGFAHPVSLRKQSTDVLAFNQVFLYQEYHMKIDFVPSIIIDAGANIGLFTVFMKNKFPEARIVCIEPDEENFQQLVKNVGPYREIYCEKKGLWYKEAKLKVMDKFNLGKWAMVVEENNEDFNVEAISIPQIMAGYNFSHIDILKLDIESSEKELFNSQYEQWLPKTRMIIIELHDTMKEGCSRQFFEAINKTFTKYELYVKGENVVILNGSLL